MNQTRIDIVSSIVVILVGLFFLILARQIKTSGFQTAAEALVGPPMVPITIASLIIGLGALQFSTILLRRRGQDDLAHSIVTENETSEFAELTPQIIGKIGANIGIGIAYVWLLSATGYLVSTAIALAALLVLFGTQSFVKVTAIAIGGAVVYYILFIKVMGIYSPIGWLVNFG